MRVHYLIIIVILASTILVCNTEALNINENSTKIVSRLKIQQNTISNDFYFVQITDTHIMHKFFDHNESSKKRLKSVLDYVCSFDKKPAFIAITGDLCMWGGSSISGALNCLEFVSCFYKKNDQLYANKDFTIPVYTTPGNHDYMYDRNLKDYHNYIDKNHVENNDCYKITYNDVSLFFLDSGPNYIEQPLSWSYILGDGLYNSEIEWFKNELNNCNSNHTIVLMHHPAISYRNEKGIMTDVIARNREEFIQICESHNVELVLAGHTHTALVFDKDEHEFGNIDLNCSLYSTLYVQSDDCMQGVHYRNISLRGNDIWLEKSTELDAGLKQDIPSITYTSKNIQKYIFITKFCNIAIKEMYIVDKI